MSSQPIPKPSGEPKKEKEPPKKIPLTSFFERFALKEKNFQVLKMWLNPGKSKGTAVLTEAKPVPLHDSPGIVDFSTKARKNLSDNRGNFDSVGLESLASFLDGGHDKSARNGSVRLPYKMYGEYGPSVTALLSRNGATVTHPLGPQAADAGKVADVLRWFGGGPKSVAVENIGPESYGKFSDLHYDWKGKDIPGRFRIRLGDLATEAKLNFFNTLYQDAVAREPALRSGSGSGKKKPAQKKTASVASGNSVSKAVAGPMFRFCVWIRNADNNPSKNMTAALFQAILEELAVTLSAYAGLEKLDPPGCELVLLGDPAGPEALPESPDIRNAMLEALNVQFPKNDSQVSVVDLRGFVELRGGNFSPSYGKNPLPAFDPPIAGVGNYMNYLDQWLVYYYLGSQKVPKFIVGTEAGNMDAIGYAGTPVISIDKADPVADVPKSILTDRIGQYALLTPLWQVVNFGGAGVTEAFREYLRGAMLRFMYFTRGGLSTAKEAFDALKGAEDDAELPPELDALFDRVPVTGDGNCLFRALAVGNGDTEGDHGIYRLDAANYARDNFELVQLNAGADGQYATRDAYHDVMSVPAEDEAHWGGYVETEAWAKAKNRTIVVHSVGNAPVTFNAGKPTTINLFWVNGNHYEFLRP